MVDPVSEAERVERVQKIIGALLGAERETDLRRFVDAFEVPLSMLQDGAESLEWAACTPEWVHRWNACGAAIRRVVLEGGDGALGGYYAGHEHLMSNGSPVLWLDALAGQQDRLTMEQGEKNAFADEEPF